MVPKLPGALGSTPVRDGMECLPPKEAGESVPLVEILKRVTPVDGWTGDYHFRPITLARRPMTVQKRQEKSKLAYRAGRWVRVFGDRTKNIPRCHVEPRPDWWGLAPNELTFPLGPNGICPKLVTRKICWRNPVERVISKL